MKKGILACFVASILIGNPLSFYTERYSFFQQASITGKISPPDGAEVVWAMNAKDTVKTGIMGGSFYLQVKPGIYKLAVKAKAPYKNILLDNLEVKENHVLDVGEIILQK